MRRATLAVVVRLSLAACTTDAGRREALFNRASFDLACDKSKLDAVELISAHQGYSRQFGVSGCEKRAAYIVFGDAFNGYWVSQDSAPTTP